MRAECSRTSDKVWLFHERTQLRRNHKGREKCNPCASACAEPVFTVKNKDACVACKKNMHQGFLIFDGNVSQNRVGSETCYVLEFRKWRTGGNRVLLVKLLRVVSVAPLRCTYLAAMFYFRVDENKWRFFMSHSGKSFGFIYKSGTIF